MAFGAVAVQLSVAACSCPSFPERHRWRRRHGGSIPIISTFEQVLGVKTILMGFGLEQNAIHSPNESMDLEVWEKGIVAVATFYQNL